MHAIQISLIFVPPKGQYMLPLSESTYLYGSKGYITAAGAFFSIQMKIEWASGGTNISENCIIRAMVSSRPAVVISHLLLHQLQLSLSYYAVENQITNLQFEQ